MAPTCPACETTLDASNTHCPVCLRPLSLKEIKQASGEKAASPQAIKLIWLVALVIPIATLGLRRKRPPPPPAQAAAPAPPVPAPAPPPPPAQEMPPPPPASDPLAALAAAAASATPGKTVTVLSQLTLPPEEARPQPPPPPAKRSARRRPSASWAVRGLVYDLITLKPVAGARLVFQDKSSERTFAAKTNAQGRYAVSLPKISSGGYELTVRHARYGDSFLEEMSPPYQRQSRARRLEAAEQLSQSQVLHVPMLPEKKLAAVTYDIVLFARQ